MNHHSFLHRVLSIALIILLTIGVIWDYNQLNVSAASKLNINLSNNQTFFILPGTSSITYDVRIISGGELGNMTCSSSNLEVASIDNMGKMILKDAGSTKIRVSSGNKSVTKSIIVLLRSDWSKVVSIKNPSKIGIKDHVCSVTLTNHMDFPVKMIYNYNTYTNEGSLLRTNIDSSPIYLPANYSFTYSVMMPEDVSFVSINHATYAYDQYGYAKINEKKVTAKESTETDSNNKTVKYKVATITNSNKNQAIIPYHIFRYDQKGQLISVEYKNMPIAGKQTLVLREVYQTKNKHAERYTAKIVYQFGKPTPYF